MPVDLKGNTNFACLKNLQDEYIVPRTNLAAIDIVVANGLAVNGSTLYAELATAEDLEYGTEGHLVDASVLGPILDSKQSNLTFEDGFVVAGTTVSPDLAVPQELIKDTSDVKLIDVDALRGALTTGQAVDVTSVPDQTITGDYKGTFTTTATTLGFTSFPKYASGLNYLMIADVTVTDVRNITPSGTWLDGATTAKALAANTATRVAMLFNAANKGKFTFSGSGTVTVSNLREYEVTACTPESISYIASLSNPDAFADYYLVKADMVQPWTYIIDMGTSPAVTIAAGLSYKLNASTGTHTLTVDTCPEGYDGRDAIIRITLGGNGVVQAVVPLQLGGALVPYAINNCVVKFRDGEAVLLVEDTLAGYVVTVTSGTDNGSLAYGLAATGVPYIAFSTGTDGSVVDMGNAVTANEEVTVVGNGYTDTTITGNITCTNKTTVANLGLQNVTVAGGTLTLGDVYIPSGSTVAVSGGGLAIEKVTGNGGVIDLGGSNTVISSGTTASASGCTIMGGSAAFRTSSYGLTVDNCTISSNGSSGVYFGGGVICYNALVNPDHYPIRINNSLITGNIAAGTAGLLAFKFDNIVLTGSTITGNTATLAGGVFGDIELQRASLVTASNCTLGKVGILESSVLTLAGSNVVDTIGYRADLPGNLTLTSGAIVDLTGNTNATPINPGGAIKFEEGGATILTGATAGIVDKQYTMGGIALRYIPNTGIINLSGGSPASTYGTQCMMSGVTLVGGSGVGGNLYVTPGAVCEITDCVISGGTPTQTWVGGGIEIQGGTVTVIGGTITGVVGTFNCQISGNGTLTVSNSILGPVGLQGGSIFCKGDVTITVIQLQYPSCSAILENSITLLGKIRGFNTTAAGGGTATVKSNCVLNYTSGTLGDPIAVPTIIIESGAKFIKPGTTTAIDLPHGTFTSSILTSSGTIIAQS